MKGKKTIIVTVFVILICFMVDFSFARDEQEGIPLSQLPKNVINAAKRALPKMRLLDAKKIIKEDGNILYLLDGAIGQEAFEIIVDENGVIKGNGLAKETQDEMPIFELPKNILNAAKNSQKGFRAIKAKIIKGKNGIENYEIEGQVDQVTYRVVVGLSGEIIETRVVDKYLNLE